MSTAPSRKLVDALALLVGESRLTKAGHGRIKQWADEVQQYVETVQESLDNWETAEGKSGRDEAAEQLQSDLGDLFATLAEAGFVGTREN